MDNKELYIKNMVCPRCILAVKDILNKHNIQPVHIELGKAILSEPLDSEITEQLRNELSEIGFELLNDSQKQIVEQIKNTIIDRIYNNENETVSLSDILTKKINRDYSFISKLFSSTEGVTIEQYTILQKVERIKELLSYDQLTLSEIADKMGYSSVAHISSQFKKITGMTPSQFKSQSVIHRKSIDNL